MTNQTEEIKTDNLTIALTRKPGCMIRLEMAVNAIGAKAAHAKAIKTVNKEISIPGFRKGKAPENLVLQQFAKYVNQEWHDILVNTAFGEFLEHTKMFPFTTNRSSIKKAEVKQASLDNGAQIIIEYESKPNVPTVDLSNLHVKEVQRQPVKAEEVEDQIRQIQLRHGEWHDVTDRPVQEGDFVDLTIEAMEHPPRTICQDMRFEVAPGKMGTWMRNLIIGHNSHETVEGMSEKESTSDIKEGEFTPTLCRITIKKVKTAAPFPLNDELAQKVGLKTIDELKPRVEQDLNNRADEQVKDELRAQMEDFVLQQYPFDIPNSLIQKQRKELLDQRVQELSRNETDPQKMVGMVKEIETDVDKELDHAYRLYFLAQKVAEENGIQVFENEILNAVMQQLMLPPGQSIIHSSMSKEEIQSKMYVNVLSAKVLDFLVTKAKK